MSPCYINPAMFSTALVCCMERPTELCSNILSQQHYKTHYLPSAQNIAAASINVSVSVSSRAVLRSNNAILSTLLY